MNPMILNQQQICKLIPHSGNMCLLEAVKFFDEEKIICSSRTHLLMDNPLRNSVELPMVSLIEYGAQAMAVHAALLAQKEGGEIKEGYLAALRDIKLAEDSLFNIKDELEIQAERIYSNAGNLIYLMQIKTKNKVLASGRATVMGKFIE